VESLNNPLYPAKDGQLQPIRPERAVGTPVLMAHRLAVNAPKGGNARFDCWSVDYALRQSSFVGSSADVAGSLGGAGLAEGE